MTRRKYAIGERVSVCLPDGKIIAGKIIEIIEVAKSTCYLVQFNGAFALVAEKDITGKD